MTVWSGLQATLTYCNYVFVIPACLSVSGVGNWPWLEGLYILDSSLEDCGNEGNLRYRQIGGLGTIWSDSIYPGNGYWHGSTTACETSHTRLFYSHSSTASRPELVSAGNWLMKDKTTGQYAYHAALTVVTADHDSCGRLQQWKRNSTTEYTIPYEQCLVEHWSNRDLSTL